MAPTAPTKTHALHRVLGLDLRSLSLLRVGLGILVLADLAIRSTDLFAHYTDGGVLPRAALLDLADRPWRFSLHLAVGNTVQVAALFVAHAAIALALIAGVRTRLMTFLCWLLLVSLHNRNPMLLNAGDTVLRLLLFWSIFLPLGGRFSLDARRSRREGEAMAPSSVLSIATVGFIAQICMIYWFTVRLKTGEEWWNGEALFYVLHIDLFVTPLGLWLRDQEWALAPLTHGTIYWELLGPFLLFVPFKSAGFRTFAILGFVGLHLGIDLTMNVGLFPYVCILAWMALTPGAVWDRLARTGWIDSLRLRLDPASRFLDRIQSKWPSLRPDTERTSQSLPGRLLVGCGLTLILVYMLLWNIRTVNFDRWERVLPIEANGLAHALRIDQKWSMFAPRPLVSDGWYVIEGVLLNGERVDLFRGGAPVSWEKPDNVLAEMPNRRWGKYLMRLKSKKYKQHRLHYARYLAREWNFSHDYDHQLESFKIHFMLEKTTATGPAPPKKITLWNHHTITPLKEPPERD